MRVGIDISQIVYEGTGSARYVERLISEFRSQSADLKMDLSLFGSAMRKREVLEKYRTTGIRCEFYPFPPKFFEVLWNQVHVVDFEVFAGKIDVYHSSDWTQAPSKAVKVTTVHDLIPFKFPEMMHPRIRSAHEARWRWIVKEVDWVIVDAECTKQDILKLFDFDAGRISVIPLGVGERFVEIGGERLNYLGVVGLSESTQDESSKTQTVQIQRNVQNSNPNIQPSILYKYDLENGKYVLAVGTMEPRKNLKRLVEAYGMLPKELRGAYPLVIVGKKAWAEQLAIPDGCDVRFTGYVEDQELPYLYAGAKLFVMPSVYEGFGLPVLEAMACGTPVLASKLSSLPEIGLESIKYFESVEDVEVMRDELRDGLENYSEDLRLSAFERAQQLSWRNTAEQTIKVYNKVYQQTKNVVT